jgi:hypothetical protein
MQLLDEIVGLATDGQTPPAVLLRKLLVLAFRLKSEKLKSWVEKELNGYGPADPLPDYRVTSTNSIGVFFGTGGSRLENIPLPTLLLKDEHRKLIDTAELRDGIATYQLSSGRDSTSGQWIIPWPPNLVAYYQSVFYPGQYALKTAWQEVSPLFVSMLLDAVQNRALRFTLELQAELGPDSEDVSAVAIKTLDRQIVTIIYGGNNLIAERTGDVHQAGSMVVNKGDFSSLATAMETLGADKLDVAALARALAEDRAEVNPSEGIGRRAGTWVIAMATKLAGKIGEAGFEVAKAEVVKELTALVAKYIIGG